MTSIKFIHVDNNHNKVSVNSSSHIKKVSFRMESPNQLNHLEITCVFHFPVTNVDRFFSIFFFTYLTVLSFVLFFVII